MTKSENPFTYPLSAQPFSDASFADPPREYRGLPFWAWNTKLDKAKFVRQVDHFKDMGMGGFHMHVRCGLDTPYMGKEFLDVVEACVDRAESENMLAALYDEDRWPSGSAGGMLTRDYPEYRSRHLLFTKRSRPDLEASTVDGNFLLGKYSVKLDPEGRLLDFKRLQKNEDGENVWYAYCEASTPLDPYNGGTYGDNLNPEAVRKFIELTHDKYYERLHSRFGTVIPSIFTDEPRSFHSTRLYDAFSTEDVTLPWSRNWDQKFKKRYGYDLLDVLPAYFWDDDGTSHTSTVRFNFHDFAGEELVANYIDQIADWCNQHGIFMLGHMEGEAYLYDQTRKTGGDCMRAYRNMGLPGIDMLCDNREYGTAKQAQSVARQLGKKGVMCEIYGVTGYEFSFEDYKGQGDWQTALGVTLRVPHLTWATMAGDAKRDYPPSIGYQSTWYKEFAQIEDHLSRVTLAMTRGTPVCRVAVVHPIESYWLSRGPMTTGGLEQELLENSFADITNWLVLGNLDFDYIAESLFADETRLEDISSSLPVGESTYDVVVLPNLRTLRSSTLVRLQKFLEKGGHVIVAGRAPELTDAKPNVPELPGAQHVCASRELLLAALDKYRDLKVVNSKSVQNNPEGSLCNGVVYQLRADGDERYVFFANTDRVTPRATKIYLNGTWKPTVLNTLTGRAESIKAKYANGQTVIDFHFDATESLLLRLAPGKAEPDAPLQLVLRDHFRTHSRVKLLGAELEEPNPLILDFAEWKFEGDEKFNELTEVLRIDNLMRERFGLPIKDKTTRQPWTYSAEERKPYGKLTLRFKLTSTIAVSGARIALERSGDPQVSLDGTPVDGASVGWWVDEDIETLALPPFGPGEHTVDVDYAYGLLTSLERLYVLGDFGVALRGRNAKIVALDASDLQFADTRFLELPFYVGNVVYNCEITVADGEYALYAPEFACPVIAVEVDGVRAGTIAFSPYILPLKDLSPGTHKVKLTGYGHRNNSFGTIHLHDGVTIYFGPRSFRTEHDWWSDEYNLKPMGIVQTVRVLEAGEEKFRNSRWGLDRFRPIQ